MALKRAAALAAATVLTLGWAVGQFVTSASADDNPLVRAATHSHWNAIDPIIASDDGTVGEGSFKNPPNPICSTTTSTAANVNTDCEGDAPHNETSIAVNPTNPSNIIGGANDYQLRLNSGGRINETIYTRAHVSFDGGKTWTMVGVQQNAYTATGDPAVAFDADGTAYLATLGFGFGQGLGCCRNPDVVVATSTDGGSSWSSLSRVASGVGVFGSQGTFNDKEYIAAWGHGNAIVTWTVFNDGRGGSYISSPIFDSVTHDGGKSWSAPQSISGSAPFCIGSSGDTACDQNQFSVPAVSADGSIHVAFESAANVDPNSLAFFRDQYLVVAVDPATGAALGSPHMVATLIDGAYDLPRNIDGSQTYQDSQFRSNSAGAITADPTNASHLAVIWSDMRNSSLPASIAAFNPNPYDVTTNSDVVVSQSFDGGVTWSSPTALTAAGDQFQPWASYDSAGKLRIGYFDRSYDAANHKYGYSIATETSAGSLSFSTTQLTTALSDPTRGDRWFSGRTPNPDFPNPTTFLGDYSGIATSGTTVVGLWTDLRETSCFGGTRCGAAEDAFFGGL